MIEITRPSRRQPLKIKVAGIGGAGANALDRVLLDGALLAETLVINTDVQALTSSVASAKIQLGKETTRGLGTGGDPEIGFAAAEECVEELREAFKGAGLVFLCAGLGGGTGSGATPLVARLARQQGALVVAFVTLPFGFEGKRRTKQALEALEQLHEQADVVLCFENDRMGEAVAPKASVHQAFAAADQTISQSVRAICELFERPGLLRLGFDEVAAALRNSHSRCIFGFGEGDGDNRAHDALARVLKNPLMDRGRLLGETSAVLVNVVGGPSMTLNELQILMEELNKHIRAEAKVLLGTAVDPKMGNKMSVTVLSSLPAQPKANTVSHVAKPAATPVAVVPLEEPEPASTVAEQPSPVVCEPSPEPMPVVQPVEPKVTQPVRKPGYVEAIQDDFLEMASTAAAPVPTTVTKETAELAGAHQFKAETASPKPREERQESLPFDKPSKGRFDKSEPTIVDGEDLDLPAFMRRKVKLK